MVDEEGRTLPTVAEPIRPGTPAHGEEADTQTAAGVAAGPAHLAEGTQLGRFKILELIGKGGMGAVYRASDPELHRHVAIKVLSGVGESRAGGAVEQRLMREAQALAKLNHPNVIAIYDVAHEQGVAFVAMELVDGVRLDTWLELRRSRTEILAAFAQAGRGLAAAHKEGLVHRDFKLANVMVGVDGRVRVLDFGLARAVASLGADEHPPLDDHDDLSMSSSLLSSPLTHAGRVLGTLKYMAPEQLRGREVDARSDQFSFCVALHGALYGEPPFSSSDLPERRASDAPWQVRPAPAGSDVPPWLRRVLLRGLSSDPAARFPSMEALLDALADDPAPRRRRVIYVGIGMLGLAAAGALLVQRTDPPAAPAPCATVADGLATAWNGDRRAAIAKTFGASDRPFAGVMQAAVTQALEGYGADWTSMRIEACRATHVTGQQSGELLDLRMQCLDRHLDALRIATEVLAAADAGVIEKALQVVQALPASRECADAEALRAPTPMPADPATREQIRAVRADLARSQALFAAGKHDDALALVIRAHDQAPALGFAPLTAETVQLLGSAQYEDGDFQAAEKTLSAGAALALTAHRDDLVVRMWRDLVSTVGYEQRRFDDADAWAALAEALLDRLGQDPREAAKLYGAIAGLRLSEDRRDEALRYDQKALDLLTRTLGESSTEVATGMTNVGSDYLAMRNFAEARDIFARVLAIREKVLGPDHPATARALVNLASANGELGNLDEATKLQRRALTVLERAYGPEHPLIATVLGNMGRDLAASGHFDEALAAYDRATAIVTSVHGAKSPQLAVLHARRATLWRRQDRTLEALAEYQAALAIDQGNDPESAATGRDVLDIADCLRVLGRHAEAQREYDHAYAALAHALGPEDIELAGPLEGLGQLALAQDHAAAAIEPLERALHLLASDDAPSDELSSTRFDLARALWDSGRDKPRALQLAAQAKQALSSSEAEDAKDILASVTEWLSKRGH